MAKLLSATPPIQKEKKEKEKEKETTTVTTTSFSAIWIFIISDVYMNLHNQCQLYKSSESVSFFLDPSQPIFNFSGSLTLEILYIFYWHTNLLQDLRTPNKDWT